MAMVHFGETGTITKWRPDIVLHQITTVLQFFDNGTCSLLLFDDL